MLKKTALFLQIGFPNRGVTRVVTWGGTLCGKRSGTWDNMICVNLDGTIISRL